MALTMLLVALGLTAVCYAHIQIPRYVATRSGIAATRGILLVIGLAFGYVAAVTSMEPTLRWLTFLAGFGAVHVPAALILLIKRARNSPKT
jgi:hypothetical protein